jgi:LCP family protein required for cell wall assembly
MPGPDVDSDLPDSAEDDVLVVDTRERGRLKKARVPSPPRSRSGRSRRRIILLCVVALVLGWVAFMIWVPFHAWAGVHRINTDPGGDRPSASKGYDYVLVGSDSREGLTRAQQKTLHTGSTKVSAGKRTDSIILVHVPSGSGKPALISLPRDSYVPIPGHGKNKINAAYTIGGPKLLVKTIEQVTDLRIDGYVEIGFGGFASVVDSLDGVDICVARPMKDRRAGINLKAGCQNLNGPDALGYVRARYSDPLGDIGRAKRQRQFLGAIMHKAVSPSTALIPWRYYGFSTTAGEGLTVGEDTSLRDVTRVLQAMRSVSGSDGLSLTVPVSNPALPTNVGSAVKWDSARASELFSAIKKDEPLTVPPGGSATP